MKKTNLLATALVIGALAAPAMAGGKDCKDGIKHAGMKKSHKCEATTQECLNYMSAQFKDKGWVGIEMDKDEEAGTLTITRIVPGSPAEAAGFQKGDILKASNGIDLNEKNEAKLKAAKKDMKPGAEVTYTVARGGKDVDLNVTLGEIPTDVLAQWVGKHMLDHAEASTQIAQN